MTNIELRNAKRHLEAALLRAYQAEVTKFEKDTGLRVTAIDVEILTTKTVGGEAMTTLNSLRVRAEV